MKFLDVPQSGSIGGTTHSHNRAGQYTRNRRSPVQPIGTGRRATVRAVFSAASAAWSGLSAADRAAWDGFADTHPITDSLGQSITLTGHQMYVRVYSSCLNVGLPAPTTPPVILTLPSVSSLVPVFDISSGISITGHVGTGGQKIAWAFSSQMSPGRSFNKTFWQPAGVAGFCDGDASPYTVTGAVYAAQFGTMVLGNRIFVRATPVSEEGWNGTPVITSGIVVA